MNKKFYPSHLHAAIHKVACATGLIVSFVIGIPALNAVTNAVWAANGVELWCREARCVAIPGAFTTDSLVVYPQKSAEAKLLVERLYKPSPLSFLTVLPPQVEVENRVPNAAANKKKGVKK